MKFIYLLLCSFILGCATPGQAPATDPAQQAIDLTYNSYMALDAAIKATDVAIKSGLLKGDKARQAVEGLGAAKFGLDAALDAMPKAAATAASGVTK